MTSRLQLVSLWHSVCWDFTLTTKLFVMKKFFTLVGCVSALAFSNAQIVINEVYTGGGVLGAAITSDFIELKNIGAASATLSGATIQYGSAAGPFTQYNELPTITLGPGQTYLIQQASGGLGILNLLNPNLIVDVVLNFDGTGPLLGVGINLGLTSGKVALASNSAQVTGPTASNVLDFVGYGISNQFEGSGAAPSPTILNSISRTAGDTNDNDVDFTISLPTPQSGGVLATGEGSTGAKNTLIRNSRVNNGVIVFAADAEQVKIYSFTGQLLRSVTAKAGGALNVADLPNGNYIISGSVNYQPVSQKFVKL
ncbi:nuclease [Flavobacteriaceae bacterium 3519-10]|nr:nuclease [Flavobacteriaceae bacterium 3519-10]